MNNKEKRCTRTLVVNIVKTLIAYVISALFGYLAYRLLINATNIQQPVGAELRTASLSVVIFAIFVYLSVRIYNLPTKDERRLCEKNELYRLQTESGYRLDYREYFKTQRRPCHQRYAPSSRSYHQSPDRRATAPYPLGQSGASAP